MAMPVGKPQWLLQPFGSFITSPIFTDHLQVVFVFHFSWILVVPKYHHEAPTAWPLCDDNAQILLSH